MNTHPIRFLILILTGAVVLGSMTLHSEAALKQPTQANPDPGIQKVVLEDASKIEALQQTALNAGEAAKSRVAAISDLSGIYFDYLLAIADKLIADPDSDVAYATLLSVGGQIAMLHDPSHGGEHHSGQEDATQTYERKLVENCVEILRMGLEHPNAKVREKAAATVSTRGDSKGMERVQQLIDSGKIEGRLGVAYLSLATPALASKYIEKYLTAANVATQAAAVGRLSYVPAHTDAIREIALKTDAPSVVVESALPGLSLNDKKFLSYAPGLAQKQSLSTAARSEAVQSITQFAIKNKTSGQELQALRPVITGVANELSTTKALDAAKAFPLQ